MRLFDSVVSPTVEYSLAATPLTASQRERLDACQRKMLRRIVGWVRFDDEAWELTGSRMKARLLAALEKQPVTTWSATLHNQKQRLLNKLASDQCNSLLRSVYEWSLAPHGLSRGQGRPRQRWYE